MKKIALALVLALLLSVCCSCTGNGGESSATSDISSVSDPDVSAEESAVDLGSMNAEELSEYAFEALADNLGVDIEMSVEFAVDIDSETETVTLDLRFRANGDESGITQMAFTANGDGGGEAYSGKYYYNDGVGMFNDGTAGYSFDCTFEEFMKLISSDLSLEDAADNVDVSDAELDEYLSGLLTDASVTENSDGTYTVTGSVNLNDLVSGIMGDALSDFGDISFDGSSFTETINADGVLSSAAFTVNANADISGIKAGLVINFNLVVNSYGKDISIVIPSTGYTHLESIDMFLLNDCFSAFGNCEYIDADISAKIKLNADGEVYSVTDTTSYLQVGAVNTEFAYSSETILDGADYTILSYFSNGVLTESYFGEIDENEYGEGAFDGYATYFIGENSFDISSFASIEYTDNGDGTFTVTGSLSRDYVDGVVDNAFYYYFDEEVYDAASGAESSEYGDSSFTATVDSNTGALLSYTFTVNASYVNGVPFTFEETYTFTANVSDPVSLPDKTAFFAESGL